MSKSFLEGIIPFITSMRRGISEEGGDTPSMSLFKIVENTSYDWTEILFDTTRTPKVTDFDLVYDEEYGGYAELIAINMYQGSRGSSSGIGVIDYSNVEMPISETETVLLPDNTWGIVTMEGVEPIYLSKSMCDVMAMYGYPDCVEGWNGSSLKEVTLKYQDQEHPWDENDSCDCEIEGLAQEENWNGIFFGSNIDKEEIVGKMMPFAEHNVLYSGLRLLVDQSRAKALEDYMETLTYEDGTCNLLEHEHGGLLMAKEIGGGNYLLTLGTKPIYATTSGSIPGVDDYVKGWNNITPAGAYTINLSAYGTDHISISKVNDTDPASWNGVIIGREDI